VNEALLRETGRAAMGSGHADGAGEVAPVRRSAGATSPPYDSASPGRQAGAAAAKTT
jgi:hypothetical protein